MKKMWDCDAVLRVAVVQVTVVQIPSKQRYSSNCYSSVDFLVVLNSVIMLVSLKSCGRQWVH